MAGKVGSSPWAAAMGVGAITDAHIRLWSRTRVLERAGGRGGLRALLDDLLVRF